MVLLSACRSKVMAGVTGLIKDQMQHLDLLTTRSLELFPLHKGAFWVFDYSGYAYDERASWKVIDTVISASVKTGFYIAEMKRTSILLSVETEKYFILAPDNRSRWWYLIDGGTVYNFVEKPSPSDIERPGVEPILILPLKEINEGHLIVDAPFDKVLSNDAAAACFQVISPALSGGTLNEFCHGVGYVYSKYDHSGTPYGFEMTLVDFHLPWMDFMDSFQP
jgi:hypothetical protein